MESSAPKIAWPSDLITNVLNCDSHYRAYQHAKNALDKMRSEGHIQDGMADHEIVTAAQVYAKMRTAEQINALQESPVQPPLIPDDPPAPAVHHSNYQDAPHAKSTRSNPRMLRED